MIFKQLIELYDLLDDPATSGVAVVEHLRGIDPACDAETYVLGGPKGATDMVRVRIPGSRGRAAGGDAPTIGLLGRLGGLGARPERIGFVSDGDGALTALACAAKLVSMHARGDVLAGRLDGELTQALLMARGLLDRGVLTVGGGEDAVSFDIRSCSVDLKAGGQPDQIEAQYTISLTLELSQSGQEGELSAERRREYEQLAARTVEERFQTLCMELQNNYRVDSLGIGRQIHRRDPVLWAQVGTDWDSAFSDCRITAQVDAALLGGGRSLE